MNYLIKNATIVNEGEEFVGDILVEDGIIAKISKASEAEAKSSGAETGEAEDEPNAGEGLQVIDATGKYLLPGLIDEHVHFREPGLTQKADIHTESRAAVAGGVTSFMDMPNTSPLTVTQDLLQQKFDLAAEKSLANYSFYIGATNDNLREVLATDFENVCGIKLFMGSSTGNMLMDSDKDLEALFSQAPCLIAAHCEDEEIIKTNTAHYRELAQRGEIVPDATLHPHVRTAEACYKSSARAVALAQKTGARLHIMHISTAAELALFRNDLPLEQKRITAETCPHYLCLTDRDYTTLGFAIKCNPAVKSADDNAALLAALGTGLIDTIGTDHAPHLKEEKFTEDYFTSKSGFPSIQHSLDLMLTLVAKGHLTLPGLVRLMCHNPAILYSVDRRGFIREGYHADLVLVDTAAQQEITDAGEHTKCAWTPYAGLTVGSRVTHTFVNGNLVYENGNFHEEFRGQRLKFNRR